jgi:hypothetical protein
MGVCVARRVWLGGCKTRRGGWKCVWLEGRGWEVVRLGECVARGCVRRMCDLERLWLRRGSSKTEYCLTVARTIVTKNGRG